MKHLAAVLLIALSSTMFAQNDTIAEHYKTKRYDCAIFLASFKGDGLSDMFHPKKITPTHTQVDLVENKIKENANMLDSLKHGKFRHILKYLGKYKRQYFGYIDSNGHRIIFVNMLRPDDDDKHEFDDFRKRLIRVCDGGDYFWQAYFDLDTNKFIGVYINGYA